MSQSTSCSLFGVLMLVLPSYASVIDISHHFNQHRSCRETDIDAVYEIPDGTVWQVRCHICRCVNGTKTCMGPSCDIDYDPSLEHSCTQWSDDDCCCQHEGCVVEGKRFNYGEWYPVPGNPCVSCQCTHSWGRSCLFSSDCEPEDIRLDESEIH